MEQRDDDANQFSNQHSQSDLTPRPNSAASGSPRRRWAPIDIDAALRLQSQASYVQAPARGSNSGAGGAGGSCSSQSSLVTLAGQPTALNTANSVGAVKPVWGQHVAPTNRYYYDQNQLYQSNNISVDYIDCLSNNDLVATQRNYDSNQFNSPVAPASGLHQQHLVVDGVNMRGIPSCRKHLKRFHRTARVEPTAAEAEVEVEAATSANGAKKQQADSTSGSLMTNTDESLSFDHQQAADPAQQQQSSVLYPISVSEVKKRTYFIGSVSQESLLSHDELYRYFPNARVSIFVCTWNQNRKRSPLNLNDLLLPDQLVYMPDIYAIGIQEAFSSQQDYLRDWDIELQTTLGPNHVLLHSCSLGTLHLSLFIRRDLIWFCSTPEESVYNSRSMPTNMIKTKGAVSIAFRFFGTSFMFTNCHFPAHENKLKDRIDEYQRIINSIDLPKNLKLLKPRYLSNDSTARFDCVFFMGDLNFRLEQRTFDETVQILEDIFQSKEQSFEALTQNDELLKVMESQQAFHGFDESPIKFPPTYKFLAQTNKYDRQTKRVPSYTDRILFRSKRQRHIQCLVYDWLPQLLSSDHKPVYCLFDVLIRPGHEQNMIGSLNAGLFQRTVYLEALKRRAEDPEGIRENGVGGNLICSIS